MEETNYAAYVYDEFGMVIYIKEDKDLDKITDKPGFYQIVNHIGHKQDYSIIPHIRRRRPLWHSKKK